MSQLCILQGTFQTNVLRYAPDLIDAVGGVLRQHTVLEHQTAAIMHREVAILGEYLIMAEEVLIRTALTAVVADQRFVPVTIFPIQNAQHIAASSQILVRVG